MKVIALCGPSGAGKTTLACLLQPYGFTIVSFARPIKLMLDSLLRYQLVDPETIYEMLDGRLKETPSPFLGHKSPRHAMQTLGMEWRDMISVTLWTDAWRQRAQTWQRIVVDDLRFLHEADAIRSLNGTIILITRNGCGPGSHFSERSYLEVPADLEIQNNGEEEEMLQKFNDFLGNDL